MVKQPFQERSWDRLEYWGQSSQSILFFITWCQYRSACYSATWLSDLLLRPVASLRNWGPDTLSRVQRPKQRHSMPFRMLRTAKKSCKGRQRAADAGSSLAEHAAVPQVTLLTSLGVAESHTSSLCNAQWENLRQSEEEQLKGQMGKGLCKLVLS